YTVGNSTTTVNVLSLAAATNAAKGTNYATTVDPSIANMLSKIQSSVHSTGTISPTTNPILDSYSFINILGDKRHFFDQRFDVNVTSKLHLSNTYHYDKFTGLHAQNFDNLNSRDPQFPGILGGTGSQNSDRWAESFNARYTLTNSMVNEFLFGVQA